jgi:hypothetical protein
MSISAQTRRKLAATLIAATCLGGSVVAIGASGQNTAAASAAPVALDSAKLAPAISKCSRLANRKARAAAAHSRGSNAGRVARRARGKAKANCLAHAKRGKKKRTQRAPVPTTQVPGGLTVGVDGGYTGWSDSEVEERADLAAPVTRHEWDPNEPVDEQDDVMEVAVGEIHTRVHALLGGNELGDPTHYREWVVAFIRRYGLGGSFWKDHPEYDEARYAITTVELGNEPYFGEMSATEYAATVGPALEDIHNLGLPVSVAVVSRVYGNDTSWIDTLYQQIPNLNTLVDAFADHPYWYGHNPSDGTAASPFGRVGTLRQRMNELGANTKAIWITEYGESTAGCGEECVSEATQAAHLSEMIGAVAGNPEWGVKMLLLYQVRDRGTSSGERELQFGLLREDGTPKPAYTVVQGAMQQFRG